jgi:predicted membrane channel-forming protein YqfA (hemolysin III family)
MFPLFQHGTRTTSLYLGVFSVFVILIFESEFPKYNYCNYLCSDWLLSGALARMLFAASEGNGDCSLLTTSGMFFFEANIFFPFEVLNFSLRVSYFCLCF